MIQRLKRVHRFYESGSYYIFELVYIFGVDKRTVYRYLKVAGIRGPDKKSRNRKICFVELLKIAKTKFFKKYIQKLRANWNKIEIVGCCDYDMFPISSIHLMFKTPIEFVEMHNLRLNQEEIDNLIFCGLLPVIKIKNKLYVQDKGLNNV